MEDVHRLWSRNKCKEDERGREGGKKERGRERAREKGARARERERGREIDFFNSSLNPLTEVLLTSERPKQVLALAR